MKLLLKSLLNAVDAILISLEEKDKRIWVIQVANSQGNPFFFKLCQKWMLAFLIRLVSKSLAQPRAKAFVGQHHPIKSWQLTISNPATCRYSIYASCFELIRSLSITYLWLAISSLVHSLETLHCGMSYRTILSDIIR